MFLKETRYNIINKDKGSRLNKSNSGIINTNVTAGGDITNTVVNVNSNNKQDAEVIEAFNTLFSSMAEYGISSEAEVEYIKSSLEKEEPNKGMISRMLAEISTALEVSGKITDFAEKHAGSIATIKIWLGGTAALFGV